MNPLTHNIVLRLRMPQHQEISKISLHRVAYSVVTINYLLPEKPQIRGHETFSHKK